jgi:membrane-associated phospholipid phosphatase
MRLSAGILLFSVSLSSGLLAQAPPLSGADPDGDRPVSWKQLIPNILDDQRHIWTFPARAFQNDNWIPVLGVSGVTAGLIATDTRTAPYFHRTTSFHGFNSVFSGTNTGIMTALVPVSFLAVGLIRKDSHATKTALLAGQAAADVEIVAAVLKGVTSRARPQNLPPSSRLSDTWFEGKRTSGSFPSGHAITAFAIATVVARRYPTHRWVPYVAYGAAGLISFSRITLSAHFPSDVFMGAALGYSISRFSVLRQ